MTHEERRVVCPLKLASAAAKRDLEKLMSPRNNMSVEKELKWHKYYIDMAKHVATKSEDRSTKVGVVIVGEDHEVLSIGYNGFPRGVVDREKYHERPNKYFVTEHAERNAVYNAARVGVSLKGSTCYFNWEPTPCADCCRALIQAGVRRFVGPNIAFPGVSRSKWDDHFVYSKEMIEDTEIEVIIIDEESDYISPDMEDK